MRIAIISDIHGNLVALEAVLADLKARGHDLLVNLGDWVTSPLWPRETFEHVESLDIPSVRGNHDRWIAEMPPAKITESMTFTHDALTAGQRAALGSLPATLAIAEDVLACHGTPASDTEYLLEEKHDERLALASTATVSKRLESTHATLILCGHSHHQHVASASSDRLVVNPGSIGCPRYADNADVPRSEAGSPHARYAIATRRAKRWSVELIVLEYDWSSVAQRARANGRPDWAEAFLRVE